MKPLLLILTLAGQLYAQDYIPNAYAKEAVQYYDALDSAQWADVYWHYDNFGSRNATYCGIEGSNRPRGKHGNEDSYQCPGVWYYTARLYRPSEGLRDSLRNHTFASALSDEIDSDNLDIEIKRGAKRPELNAAQRYHRGKSWRSALVYGLTFMARQRELEKRMEEK